MKQFLKMVFGACMVAGLMSLVVIGNYAEVNDITLALVGYGVIGVALILVGYRGLKLTGCKCID